MKKKLVVVVGVSVLSIVPAAWSAAGATAVLHPGKYTLRTVTLLQDPNSTSVGGYLACKNPNTHRLVAGGGYWHAPGKGPTPSSADPHLLGSSAVTTDGKRWYADARVTGPSGGGGGEAFTMVALCLPKAQVGTYTLRTVTYDVAGGAKAGNYVGCPANQRIVTGGAYWHAQERRRIPAATRGGSEARPPRLMGRAGMPRAGPGRTPS